MAIVTKNRIDGCGENRTSGDLLLRDLIPSGGMDMMKKYEEAENDTIETE